MRIAGETEEKRRDGETSGRKKRGNDGWTKEQMRDVGQWQQEAVALEELFEVLAVSVPG